MARTRKPATTTAAATRTAAPRRQPLSHARIVDAAVALADADGIESVGMRSVARRLGVDPMSLYNHVDGKTALFDGIVVRIFELAGLPDGGRWDEWARAAASRFMAVALEHPGAFSVLGSHSVATVDAAVHVEPFAAALLEAGFPPESCAAIINAFIGFVASYALLRTHATLTTPLTPEEATVILEQFHSRLPAISAIGITDTPVDPDTSFDLGVELLIEGLRSRLRRTRRGR